MTSIDLSMPKASDSLESPWTQLLVHLISPAEVIEAQRTGFEDHPVQWISTSAPLGVRFSESSSSDSRLSVLIYDTEDWTESLDTSYLVSLTTWILASEFLDTVLKIPDPQRISTKLGIQSLMSRKLPKRFTRLLREVERHDESFDDPDYRLCRHLWLTIKFRSHL